jgi:hypothetical protein
VPAQDAVTRRSGRSLARIYDMVAAGSHPAADHPMPSGSCCSCRPGVVEQAWSPPDNRRDFSAGWIQNDSADEASARLLKSCAVPQPIRARCSPMESLGP